MTAIELMPVADFPGRRGWGYDGVDLFAPARCYGTPDDLRRLVDEAHRLGLAVLLDVVYNHFGPDGNYLAQFSPLLLLRRPTAAPGAPPSTSTVRARAMVREFFIENALHWVHEYHFDGLRLDATHHLVDDGPRHFLAELSARVRESVPDRPIHLIAEDPRNLAAMLRGESEGGWGLDGVWSDDFHHQLRRYLVGDDEGVFRDFRGTPGRPGDDDQPRLAVHGRIFDPPPVSPGDRPRRARAAAARLRHPEPRPDRQPGIRRAAQPPGRPGHLPSGRRLAARHAGDAPAVHGAGVGGQAPFLFFTDHEEELGRKVREGRRREFRQYAAFADPARHALIPDIQDDRTFLACKLDWSERDREPHASTLRLHRALLHLRRTEPALRANKPGSFEAVALGEDVIILRRDAEDGPSVAIVVRLKGSGTVDFREHLAPADRWEMILTTEDPPFAPDPTPPEVSFSGEGPSIHFRRPSAVFLRAGGSTPGETGVTDE